MEVRLKRWEQRDRESPTVWQGNPALTFTAPLSLHLSHTLTSLPNVIQLRNPQTASLQKMSDLKSGQNSDRGNKPQLSFIPKKCCNCWRFVK